MGNQMTKTGRYSSDHYWSVHRVKMISLSTGHNHKWSDE